jgi:hypothetical protein
MIEWRQAQFRNQEKVMKSSSAFLALFIVTGLLIFSLVASAPAQNLNTSQLSRPSITPPIVLPQPASPVLLPTRPTPILPIMPPITSIPTNPIIQPVRPVPPLPFTPIVPPTPIQDYSCVTPPSGLVGWWKGDGNTLDSSGLGNNGVAVNITYTNGIVGQAFACDPENYPYGTYNAVDIPDSPAYVLTVVT